MSKPKIVNRSQESHAIPYGGDTPRTDAFVEIEAALGLEPLGLVPAAFARSLERENFQLKMELALKELQKEDILLGYDSFKNKVKNLQKEVEMLHNVIRDEWPPDQAEEIIDNCKK